MPAFLLQEPSHGFRARTVADLRDFGKHFPVSRKTAQAAS
jgi:hypothetical protein